MQDNFNDFDQLMRSMLEDAEVKPSRRVWKGVSSRLDAAEAVGAASWGWMRWAGAGLAFAAMLTIGIFFTGTRQQPVPSDGQLVELVADAQGTMEMLPVEDSDLSAESSSAVHGGPRASRRSYVAQAVEPVEVSEPVQEAVVEEASAEEIVEADKETSGASVPAARVRRPQQSRSFNTDPFAVMAAEDSRKGGRKASALYAKGAIGGNDSDIHFTDRVNLGAPGALTTGIREESTSSYGIPFTLGLGARFYVLDRLSIGTGLDYSLLTRTFSGKYSDGSREEAGHVLHTLQYVGVPVNLYYDVLTTDKVKFYVYGGGEAEYCVGNKYRLFANPDIVCTSPVKKLQYSAGLGLGVEFKLSRLLGLYLDPEMKYYFPCDQPKSIRTDKPLMVGFDAGLRFNF